MTRSSSVRRWARQSVFWSLQNQELVACIDRYGQDGLPSHTTERGKQDVFPAASMGRTHAFDERTGMYAPGLRGAGNAQRNGFTAVRSVPREPVQTHRIRNTELESARCATFVPA
jgi:hypothetical protein